MHLDHDALKDLEVTSVGHRLYILKQIYNLKIAHGIKFEKDDYVPICISLLSLYVRELTSSRAKRRRRGRHSPTKRPKTPTRERSISSYAD